MRRYGARRGQHNPFAHHHQPWQNHGFYHQQHGPSGRGQGAAGALMGMIVPLMILFYFGQRYISATEGGAPRVESRQYSEEKEKKAPPPRADRWVQGTRVL
eukprot:SAG11_NODE_1490_length_4810_cov_4.090851_4_plen_101_part_00